jgi:hypothetical protein
MPSFFYLLPTEQVNTYVGAIVGGAHPHPEQRILRVRQSAVVDPKLGRGGGEVEVSDVHGVDTAAQEVAESGVNEVIGYDAGLKHDRDDDPRAPTRRKAACLP